MSLVCHTEEAEIPPCAARKRRRELCHWGWGTLASISTPRERVLHTSTFVPPPLRETPTWDNFWKPGWLLVSLGRLGSEPRNRSWPSCWASRADYSNPCLLAFASVWRL